ncbi:MAG: DUF2793 domain-containing protein [Pikeienuella sp.]
MTETPRFGLTLLEAAQAQKHMTVNEALVRLDALAAVSLSGIDITEPPEAPVSGAVYAIGSGATADWAGADGRLAIASGGGWQFADPWPGLRAWNAAQAGWWVHLGDGLWVAGAVAVSAGGAATLARVAEIDHSISPGSVSTISDAIPDKAVVLGISARVTSEITGAGSWRLGVGGSNNRYGSGFGGAIGSVAEGVTGSPVAYYGGTDLLITAESGSFSAGALRIAIHYWQISAPL